MRFSFDKAACQNTRRALQKEWLLANGLGDYASSSILYCNTRKYHGLLVASLPEGRSVLFSAMEESICGGGKEFFISTRQHPGRLYPQGNLYLEAFSLDPWPQFTYRMGDVRIKREILLVQKQRRLLIRWSISGTSKHSLVKLPDLSLKLKPLLAYRGFHQLTHANDAIQSQVQSVSGGFGLSPYPGMPPIYFQLDGYYQFKPQPEWYYNVEYFQEQERGFDYKEDLFQPGIFNIHLPPLPKGGSIYLSVSTKLEDNANDIAAEWEEVSSCWYDEHKKVKSLIEHFEKIGEVFCTENQAGEARIIAGYHWFDAWGRDTLIALPGLAFYGGRTKFGLDILSQVPDSMHNGLIPNIFGDKDNHAYNSADASLWYAFAIQCYLREKPDALEWIRHKAWPALKEIVAGYTRGPGMDIYIGKEGLLHAGNEHTQLTWMDANVNGQPVTPRHGCPVELNALWYNTLAFVDYLAKKFDEPEWRQTQTMLKFRQTFLEHFWIPDENGYLGDVWRDGWLDKSIRPNQILAISLPYPVLKEQYRPQVLECVREKLLTPYGLRTLAPSDPAYKGRYEGSPENRDAAYHQGTVWPWLLGQYTDALLRVAWDVEGAVSGLLKKVTPLFSDHLVVDGLGNISEIFNGNPPAKPNGTIAQAWSVAECLRMLVTLKRAAPQVYSDWEQEIAKRLAHLSDDTAGICRVDFTIDDGPSTASKKASSHK